jgi:uncharacterized lipoprotein
MKTLINIAILLLTVIVLSSCSTSGVGANYSKEERSEQQNDFLAKRLFKNSQY